MRAPPTPEPQHDAAARLARLVIAAHALGLDTLRVTGALATLGAALDAGGWATLDAPFDRLGVWLPWPAAADAALGAKLGEVFPRSTPEWIDRLLSRPARTRELGLDLAENGTGRLRLAGRATLDEDLVRAREFADLSTAQAAALATLARRLCGPRGEVVDAFEVGHVGDSLAITLHLRLADAGVASRLATVLAGAGVSGPQERLVAAVHPALAGSGVVVGLTASQAAPGPRVSLTYAKTPWEDVVKLGQGLYPDSSAGPRLGALAGALDAGRAEAVALVLGPSEPPGFGVACAISATPTPRGNS